MTRLEDLEQFFNGIELSQYNGIKLDAFVIDDAELFVKTHLLVLKNNSGKRTFLPYFERLLALHRQIISQQSNG